MDMMNHTAAAAQETLQTIYFSKLFTSGLLKGITVHGQQLTGSLARVARIRIGAKGRDAVTGAKFTIVDASFQSYAR